MRAAAKVPASGSARRAQLATTNRRTLAPCRFATGFEIAHFMAQEVQAEGVLHVSAAQLGSCMERWGDLEGIPPLAPELPALDAVLTAGDGGKQADGDPRVVNEAFCLATPPDNPAETNPSAAALRQAAAAPGGSAQPVANAASSRPGASRSTQQQAAAATAEAEEVATEVAMAQRAALYQAVYTSDVLRASAAVRRRRRRALVRALRSGRSITATTFAALADTPPGQLLASISGSVSSWDDDEDGSGCSQDSDADADDDGNTPARRDGSLLAVLQQLTTTK